MKTKIATLTIIVLTLLSCNDSKKTDSEATIDNEKVTSEVAKSAIDNSIENTKWLITTVGGAEITNTETNHQEVYFTLDSKTNQISGNSGCNTFMGTYKLEEGNRISFSEMASTRKMCPDSKVSESDILEVFNTADNYTINNGRLGLNKAKKAPLAEFKSADMTNNPIVETKWKLKTLQGKDVSVDENVENKIFFMLKSKDSRVTGFAGCNTISGAYTIEDGSRINFEDMVTTLKACPNVDFNEAEFLKVFELADNFSLKDNELSLNVGKRAPLAVFESVGLEKE